MAPHNHNSSQKSKILENPVLLETSDKEQNQVNEYNINGKYILEFISRHHLNSLWDEFIYEKNHPKTPLSATEVLAMINLPPEEQDRILKDHE
jgi:hypothetical protein